MSDIRKAWSADQDHAISTLVKKHGTHRWSEISKRMLDHFGAPGRTGKQCRQRWHNHLNPKINKSAWTEEEQKILFQCHQQYGNKWKSIAQHLKGRTDNDIKNKFYSSMRKKLRKINKMLGVKNSTSQVRQIKPKVLSNIIAAASSNNQEVQEAWLQLSRLIFCRDDKKLSKLIKGEDRTKVIELIEKISSLNQVYLESKDSDKLERMVMNRQTTDKQPQQQGLKSGPTLKRRISLRKRSTNKSNNQKKNSKQMNESMLFDQDNFNFSINFADSMNRDCFSPGFHSFTPVLFKKNSVISTGAEKEVEQWRGLDSFLNSPMVTRSLTRTPNIPTPGVNPNGMVFDFKNNQFGKNQLYDQIFSNLKNKVQQNIQARQ